LTGASAGEKNSGGTTPHAAGILGEEVLVRFKVAIYPSEEGFAVSVPSLPGCWSQGATEQEALTNIADAIRDYLEAEGPPPEGWEIREIEVTL